MLQGTSLACMLATRQARRPLPHLLPKAFVFAVEDLQGCRGRSQPDLTLASFLPLSPLAGLFQTPAGVIFRGQLLASLNFRRVNLRAFIPSWRLEISSRWFPPWLANILTQVFKATLEPAWLLSPPLNL